MKSSLQKLYALRHNHTARKGVTLTALLYLSPAVGLLLDNILVRYFGVGITVDTFRLITSFMLLSTGLVANILLKYALIPELAHYKAKNDLRGGLRFVTVFTILTLLLLTPLVGLGLLRPDMLLGFLGPGLQVGAEAYLLVRIACISFVLIIISGSFIAVLQFYATFWGQPIGQFLLNSTILIAVLLFAGTVTTSAQELYLLAYSLLAGAVAMLSLTSFMILHLWLRTLRYIIAEKTNIQQQSIKALVRSSLLILLPLLVIMLVGMFNSLLVNRTISYMDVGSITIYNYAFKLLMLGHLPLMAFITVLFPDIAKAHAANQNISESLKKRSLILLGMGMSFAVILSFSADIIVYVAFGLSNFTEAEHMALVNVFRILIWNLPAGALVLFLVESLYAQKRLAVIFAYMISYTAILYSLLLYAAPYDLTGISTAYVCSTWISLAILGAMKLFNIKTRNISNHRP